MDRLALSYGAYSARSVVASAQRCVNLYMEQNPEDSAFPWTCYQRPGMRAIARAESAPWRMLHPASNGNGYGVCGPSVYYIGPDWSLTKLGSITPGRSTPCYMTDNGVDVLLVDGSPNGWTWKIADNSGFAQVSDPTGFFQGGDRCDVLDTYILWNIIGSNLFGSTLSNELVFDPLYFAGKSAYPDPLQTLIVNRRELLLPGLYKTEIWYDAGNTNLPFAELPGAYIEHGIAAKYSLASSDISVFWLGYDLQNGQHYVFRQRGYETKVISNPAISFALRSIKKSSGTLSDCIGYCYSQDGHTFYVMQFPSGNQTWVYDDSIPDVMRAWSQRAWTSPDGALNRDRSNCYAALYGRNIVGDWQNGQLYELDPDYYYDQVDAGSGITEGAISWIRGFPHTLGGIDKTSGQLLASNGRQVTHEAFWIAMETGTDPTQNATMNFSLRFSDDWGKTYGNAVLTYTGEQGQYSTLPQYPTLGLSRFRQYEVSWSYPAQAALQGAWWRGRIQEANR